MMHESDFGKHSRLPDKPSELLKLALGDLQKAEGCGVYKIYMNEWHRPEKDPHGEKVCAICMAGAVMAYSLDCKVCEDAHPADFDKDTCNKLFAIDRFRMGQIGQAYLMMGRQKPETIVLETIELEYYEPCSDDFKQDIYGLIDFLQDHGE